MINNKKTKKKAPSLKRLGVRSVKLLRAEEVNEIAVANARMVKINSKNK